MSRGSRRLESRHRSAEAHAHARVKIKRYHPPRLLPSLETFILFSVDWTKKEVVMILEMPYLCAGSLVFVPGGLVFRRRYYFGARLCVIVFTWSKGRYEIRCDCKFIVVHNTNWLRKHYVGGLIF